MYIYIIYIYIYVYIYIIYINLQVLPCWDYPIFGEETTRARKRFKHPLLIIKPATMTESAQTTISPYQH